MREELLYKLRDRIIENAEIELDEDPDYTEVWSNIYHGDVGIWYHSRHKETIVEVINEANTRKELTNVTGWLEEHLQRADVLDELADKVAESSEDEWQSHGFRDAQDYYNYRFGNSLR